MRATLAGCETASAAGITVTSPSPVLALCRKLLTAGYDPATPLEVYRDNTLALRVRSIGEAAGLRVAADKAGRPVFKREETGAAAPRGFKSAIRIGGRVPPMSDRRRRDTRRRDTRMAGVYRRVRLLNGNESCVYCGSVRAATWDHVYPVCYAATLRDLGIETDENLKVMVRACRRCNSTAGSRLFKSFEHKRAFIRERLHQRYGAGASWHCAGTAVSRKAAQGRFRGPRPPRCLRQTDNRNQTKIKRERSCLNRTDPHEPPISRPVTSEVATSTAHGCATRALKSLRRPKSCTRLENQRPRNRQSALASSPPGA